MDSLWSVVILAIAQGVTEFLPVSSSGHLVLLKDLTGLQEAEGTLEVLLHLGTLVAVLVFFRQRILDLLRGAIKGEGNGRLWVLAVILGSIPAGLAGVLAKDFFEQLFNSLTATGCCLLATGVGLALLGGPPRTTPLDRPRWLQILIVGVAQALAILPGISRSGATIIAGMRSGLDRRAAGEFSFFLSLPAVGGAALLKTKDITGAQLPLTHLLIGVVVAAVVGYFCLGLLMWMLKVGRLRLFAPWCLLAGAIALWRAFG